MHIISKKAIRESWKRHPESQAPLSRWFKIMQRTEFRSFAELRATFPSADMIDDLIIFNIGGNKYRLIAAIHFNRGRVYIRHVVTHQEYDRNRWNI